MNIEFNIKGVSYENIGIGDVFTDKLPTEVSVYSVYMKLAGDADYAIALKGGVSVYFHPDDIVYPLNATLVINN